MDMRTHRCGEVGISDAGDDVVVMGWVRTHRDHGRVVFLDLWDREGMIQIVADPRVSSGAYETAQELRSEYVVAVRGEVRARPAGTENTALRTGAVEVAAREIEVLNEARVPPFPLGEGTRVDEGVRARYRYLDLRQGYLQRNLRLRHKAIRAMRAALDREAFVEVETPVLTRSTPEGARDYLVPSRVHPGTFYALPQSPQQMKQLLMVGGVDRYYQIARCFRDEDLRTDRQPEFTQLDLEMSFVDQDDVLALMEAVIHEAVHAVRPDLALPTPFPRLTHAEAIARYGTDKPDMRWGMSLVDLTDVLEESEIRIFRQAVREGGAIKGIRVSGGASFERAELEHLQTLSRREGADGVIWFAIDEDRVRSPVARYLSPEMVARIRARMKADVGDLMLVVAGDSATVARTLDQLRREMGNRLGLDDEGTLAFAWVVDFPLFRWDEANRRWGAEHHPFTRPKQEDLPWLERDPGRVRADCYDLVCNGWELGSGSIRIHRRSLQARVLDLMGYTPERAEVAFGHLLQALEFGAPPHGGIAVGVDRLVALLAETDTLRDVIAFPKNRQAVDPMMSAPSPVPCDQLEALGIRVSESEPALA